MIIIKKIINKLLAKFGYDFSKKNHDYKIGNLKHHNARVDALTPKFVEIGDDFVSAPGAIVLSHDASPFINTGCYRVEQTVIGDRVFLGANSVVLPGVVIGDDVIVGAGAVVTKNVNSGFVVAGNPARVLCTINDYFEKCKDKGCLYKAPESFDVIRNDGRPKAEDIVDFQEEILTKSNAGHSKYE